MRASTKGGTEMKIVRVNTRDKWDSQDFFSDAVVEHDGAIKWLSNGRYLMADTGCEYD